uniref:Uncharacterized protein LOC110195499 n=1 Tax=Phascolarctos cinereus TaxID=38626 RepID=A0A6P5ISD8_PHACI|nr:uncharacterized protein LOC110195499 [Phascolarctos cinereus]
MCAGSVPGRQQRSIQSSFPEVRKLTGLPIRRPGFNPISDTICVIEDESQAKRTGSWQRPENTDRGRGNRGQGRSVSEPGRQAACPTAGRSLRTWKARAGRPREDRTWGKRRAEGHRSPSWALPRSRRKRRRTGRPHTRQPRPEPQQQAAAPGLRKSCPATGHVTWTPLADWLHGPGSVCSPPLPNSPVLVPPSQKGSLPRASLVHSAFHSILLLSFLPPSLGGLPLSALSTPSHHQPPPSLPSLLWGLAPVLAGVSVALSL